MVCPFAGAVGENPVVMHDNTHMSHVALGYLEKVGTKCMDLSTHSMDHTPAEYVKHACIVSSNASPASLLELNLYLA